jgi:hypothetical protein
VDVISSARMNGRTFRLVNVSIFLVAAACAVWKHGRASEQDERGTLTLSILDAALGTPTAARVQVVDSKGTSHMAEDVLRVGGD